MQVCPVCSTEVSTSSGTGTTGCWLGWWMNWWMVLSFYYCVKTEKHQTINNMISDNCIVCYLLVIYYNLYIICCSWLATYLTFFMELWYFSHFSFVWRMCIGSWLLSQFLESLLQILEVLVLIMIVTTTMHSCWSYKIINFKRFVSSIFGWHYTVIIRQNECIVWSYKKRNSIRKNWGFVKHIEVVWLFARISILNT